MSLRAARRFIERSPSIPVILVIIAVLAIFVRLIFLGSRIAHWDEGRVGYETLRVMATGAWEYRPIVHGPFLPHVNKHVFALIGANDFSSRLIVAIIGGLLPLSAWLYREHLRKGEMITLALFLAADPILVYYSRFMRNDVIIAAFVFVAVGFFVRLTDTGRARYLYAGVGSFALAFTAKENAILYVLALLGALLLLFDHRLFLARNNNSPWTTVAWQHVSQKVRVLWRWRLHLGIAVIEFLVIIIVFFAPRAGVTNGIGLWKTVGQPTMIPAVIEAATLGSAEKLVTNWITGSLTDHAYLPFFTSYAEILVTASGSLVLLAIIGFTVDRYTGDQPRDIIALGFYWGFVSLLGYPIAIDIKSAWAVTHTIVPLAIPAAFGAMVIFDWGRDAAKANDGVSVGLAGLVLILVAGGVVGTTATSSYMSPQQEGNIMVQYAQPEGEMRPALTAIRAAATENEGLDVIWYGEHFLVENESLAYRLPIADGEWYNRLPLPWYLEAANATVNSTADRAELQEIVEQDRVPIIITRLEEAEDLSDLPDSYERHVYEGRQFGLTFVFYIIEEYDPATK